MTIRTLLLSLALLSGAEAVSAAPKDPKTRPTPTTFKIDVHRMIPMAYRSHSLDPGYSVEVRNDSLICYLPYVGQNYTANPVGGVQLDFAVPIHSREQREGASHSFPLRRWSGSLRIPHHTMAQRTSQRRRHASHGTTHQL